MICVDFAKNIQVVVLMGGLGTRLASSAGQMPKTMADVNGKPFFRYMLDLLMWNGFRKFLFCTGYRSQAVKDYFRTGEQFGVKIQYSSDAGKLLGTAGALRKAINKLDEDFLLIYGDSFMDIDYNQLIHRYFHCKKKQNKKALMAVFHNSEKYDKSNILLKNGRLIRYDKKKPATNMKHIDYGISILNKALIAKTPNNGQSDLAEIYQYAVKHNLIAAFNIHKRFYEIGSPASLGEFRKFIHQKNKKQKAVILDRDGTLNKIIFNDHIGLLDSPIRKSDFEFIPQVCRALKILQSLGYLLIVATNQPAAAKGKTTLKKLYDINELMLRKLRSNGIAIDDIFICPHHPKGDPNRCTESFLIAKCPCRKPGSAMIKQAIEKHNIDIENSFMVGDSYIDMLAGQKENLKTVFLGNFKCDVCQLLGGKKANMVFKNLYEFAKHLEDKEK